MSIVSLINTQNLSYNEIFIEAVLSFLLPGIMFFILYKALTYYPSGKKLFKKGFNSYPEIQEDTLRNLGLEKESLTTNLTKIYENLENLIIKHDSKSLNKICENTFYNEIKSLINERKKNQVTMKVNSFSIIRSKIIKASKANQRLEIQLLIETETNIENNNKLKKYKDLYLVKFIKDETSSESKTDECQNCGAPIKNGENICPYCDRKTGNIRRYEDWTILDRNLL